MNQAITCAAALAAASLLGGCMQELEFDNSWEQAERPVQEAWFGGGDDVRISDAALNGQIGPVTVDGPAYRVTGYSTSSWTNIDVTVRAGGEAAMAIFVMDGGFEELGLAVGESITLDGGNDSYSTTAPYVSVTGCSGDRIDWWDWDRPAEDVEVVVTAIDDPEAPGQVLYQVDFVAEFEMGGGGSLFGNRNNDQPSGTHTVSGTFTVAH